MRAEKRPDDVYRMRLSETGSRAQHLQLGCEIETVAALHLAGGGAARQHLVQPIEALPNQFVLRSRAGGGDGRKDPASSGGNLGVGGAGEPPPELVAPIAREDKMGVGIHETRDD